ncbi:MAG: hypothetical protein QOF60_826 [Actinomycetota bacterium]|nr:hypothetical protein [Actinomycetota bacterium]
MIDAKSDLVDLSDWAWQRLLGRMAGMTDDEYRWQPVPGSDAVTTIAWRLFHIADGISAPRIPIWLGLAADALPRPTIAPEPATASAAIAQATEAYAYWRACLELLDEDILDAPIGAVGGQWGASSHNAFALHMVDELIHHGAEVALVRDLYGAQSSS